MEKLQDIELKKMLTELADMLQTVYLPIPPLNHSQLKKLSTKLF